MPIIRLLTSSHSLVAWIDPAGNQSLDRIPTVTSTLRCQRRARTLCQVVVSAHLSLRVHPATFRAVASKGFPQQTVMYLEMIRVAI